MATLKRCRQKMVNRNRNNRLDLQQRIETHGPAGKDVKVVVEVLLKPGQTRSTGSTTAS